MPPSKVGLAQRALGIKINQAPTVITSASGDAKAQQAWKYPGFVIQRAPGVTLKSGKQYTDNKPGSQGLPRRVQESNFSITISTLKSPSAANLNRAYHCLNRALQALASEQVFVNIIKFGPKSAWFRDDLPSDVITGVDWNASIELGGKYNRLHAHILVTIRHYSQIQIDPFAVERYARTAWNRCVQDQNSPLYATGKFYVHVKPRSQKDYPLISQQYIIKDYVATA